MNPRDEKRAAAKRDRDALLRRLEKEGSEFAPRLAKCGRRVWLKCRNCDSPRAAESRCNLKWCPACANALATRCVKRFEKAVTAFEWPLFVTFTTRNFKTGPECVREVRRAFGKLRRLRWWRRAVKGGVAGIEVTNRGKGWHPHVHALIDCRWLAVNARCPGPLDTAQKRSALARAACTEVAEQWSLCMGGRRSSVKPRRVFTREGSTIRDALAECLKYSVTAENLLTITEDLNPLIQVLDKTRLVTSWGTAYRLGKVANSCPLCPCETCNDPGDWTLCDKSEWRALSDAARKFQDKRA